MDGNGAVRNTSPVIPPIDSWAQIRGSWHLSEEGHSYLVTDGQTAAVHLISPPIELQKNVLYSFKVSADVDGPGYFAFALSDGREGADPSSNVWKRVRTLFGPGQTEGGFSFLPAEDMAVTLCIANGTDEHPVGCRVRPIRVTASASGVVPELSGAEVDTYLPHWGRFRRWIHQRCKNSRDFNAFVAALEMRLGREESLSLPMYLALCPTGQCNALCDFCSVTINRTGIIKKQLPWDRLSPFLQATKNTLSMCGLEGNGEPTLYKQFDELVALLRQGNSEVYLITNGSRLTPEQIPNVCSLNSVTFSLNACTEETHKRVMKLKNWPDIVRNIKAVVAERGAASNPSVFVSFVVHNQNIHELQAFLQFAEYELKADVIMIRPLSELGTDDLGTIEDLRDIVPYESDVRDALEAVGEYLQDIPRRPIPFLADGRTCEIRFDANTFHNVRPDPVDRVVMPYGYENCLLAPRRTDWQPEVDGLLVQWHLNSVRILCPEQAPAGVVWSSAMTPVAPGQSLKFSAKIRHLAGTFVISAITPEGKVLGSVTVTDPEDPLSPDGDWREYGFEFETGDALRAQLVVSQPHAGGFVSEIDFGRLRTPGMGIKTRFQLPFPRRWAVDTAGVNARWKGHVLDLSCGATGRNYLYKSYFSPCMAEQTIELPVSVTVREGHAVIGFLSQDAQKWVVQYKFPKGHHEKTLVVETGENRRLQAVIFSANGEPLDMTVDWGDLLEPTPERTRIQSSISRETSSGQDLSYPFPGFAPLSEAGNWSTTVDGTVLEPLSGGGFRIRNSEPPSGPYLCSSVALPLLRNTQATVSAEIEVHSGAIYVGFLNRSMEWISQTRFGTGKGVLSVPVSFPHGEVLTAIVFSDGSQALDATVVFSNSPDLAVEGMPRVLPARKESAAEEIVVQATPAVGSENKVLRKPKGPTLWQRLMTRMTTSDRRIYCQKPWTDLNNFTVDGRMDVCCISTGASQARYALGDIHKNSFQEIWNGSVMREFRRTVNSDKKLPPCERCPMSGAYSGLFFDHEHTYTVLRHRISLKLFGGVGSKTKTLMTVIRFIGDALHFKYMR